MDPAVARRVLGSAGTSASPELSSWELPPFCAARWLLRYLRTVILQMQRTLLLSRLFYRYRWRIRQNEEGKVFVVSLCLGKQSQGRERREKGITLYIPSYWCLPLKDSNNAFGCFVREVTG